MRIVILIPEVTKEPRFDLVDSETGIEREMTKEELIQLTEHLSVKNNYLDVADVVNAWPLNSQYEQVIDDKGPIYVKDDKRYQLYCLDENRINLKDVKKFIEMENVKLTDLEIIIQYTESLKWLKAAGFIKHR